MAIDIRTSTPIADKTNAPSTQGAFTAMLAPTHDDVVAMDAPSGPWAQQAFAQDIQALATDIAISYQTHLKLSPEETQALENTLVERLYAFAGTSGFNATPQVIANNDPELGDRLRSQGYATKMMDLNDPTGDGYWKFTPHTVRQETHRHGVHALRMVGQMVAADVTGYIPPCHERIEDFQRQNDYAAFVTQPEQMKALHSLKGYAEVPEDQRYNLSTVTEKLVSGETALFVFDKPFFNTGGVGTTRGACLPIGQYLQPYHTHNPTVMLFADNLTHLYDIEDGGALLTLFHEGLHGVYDEGGHYHDSSPEEYLLNEYHSRYHEFKMEFGGRQTPQKMAKEFNKEFLSTVMKSGAYQSIAEEYTCNHSTLIQERWELVSLGWLNGKDMTPELVREILYAPSLEDAMRIARQAEPLGGR